MTRGDSRTLDFSDLADSEGLAYDLNTVTAAEFRVDGLFEKVLADFDIDASAGELFLDIFPADTEDSSDERRAYRYDLQLTFTGGNVKTVRRGQFIVVPDVEDVE
jgi:hypothetical protein